MSNKSSILSDYYKYTSDYKKEYGENTVVFMQVGSFYEIYGIKENDNDTSEFRNFIEQYTHDAMNNERNRIL